MRIISYKIIEVNFLNSSTNVPFPPTTAIIIKKCQGLLDRNNIQSMSNTLLDIDLVLK
jgi:hypothetical protein